MYITPKGLFGRFFLIIILPILILQIITAYIFYQRHWESVSRHMEMFLISDLKSIIYTVKHHPDQAQKLAENMGLQIALHDDDSIFESLSKITEDSTATKLLEESMRAELKLEFKLITKPNTPNSQALIVFFWLENGKILEIEFSRKRFISPTTIIFSLWVIGSAGLLIAISLAFMKNQVRAVINLAVAADKLGKGHEIKGFKPSGAREVKIAGKAFIIMKERMERQINYRTEMLAHISHDLRTPLTRMRLQAAMLTEEEAAKDFERNIDEMEKLIHGYLDFAKEEGNEKPVNFDFVAKIENVVASFRNKHIKLNCAEDRIMVTLRVEAIRRALTNIISNSVKYAHQKILINVLKRRGLLIITIDDDGPGIEKSKYDLAFQPFSKLDRSMQGYGLGLAIVKSIVLSHGGKIKLSKSSLGGLCVTIKLPLRSLKWID